MLVRSVSNAARCEVCHQPKSLPEDRTICEECRQVIAVLSARPEPVAPVIPASPPQVIQRNYLRLGQVVPLNTPEWSSLSLVGPAVLLGAWALTEQGMQLFPLGIPTILFPLVADMALWLCYWTLGRARMERNEAVGVTFSMTLLTGILWGFFWMEGLFSGWELPLVVTLARMLLSIPSWFRNLWRNQP